jgi:hypothetical protein
MSIAALLGGWAIWNRNRPERDTPVGVALLLACVLVGFAILYTSYKSFERMGEESRRDREQREQEQREYEEQRERERNPPEWNRGGVEPRREKNDPPPR